MTEPFGTLPDGSSVFLYTIQGYGLTAKLCPLGATLVRLYAPDKNGNVDDVVLGYKDAAAYRADWMNIGATVGRCANRIRGGVFTLNNKTYTLAQNNLGNNLHSGPDFYSHRMWEVEKHTQDAITFILESPDGDQGFPGNATIRVCYRLKADKTLSIRLLNACDNADRQDYYSVSLGGKPLTVNSITAESISTPPSPSARTTR